ncbi:MAG: cache domain-containing protein, partial [Burkholderiales bacterium]
MTQRRLSTKYFALIVALVSGALLVSSGISLWFAYQESIAALSALQREKANAAAYRIEQFVRGIEHEIGWTTLPRALEGVTLTEQRRIEFLKLLRQAPAVTDVHWLDPRGREQLRVSRLAMDVAGSGDDFSQDARFVEARNGRAYFSPVYFRKQTEPYMTVARASGGGGVTAIDVNLKFVWDVVSEIRIGKAGLAYVVDSNGHLIAHPDISLVLQNQDWSSQPQVVAARLGGNERIVTRDHRGAEVLTASAAIRPVNWLLVADVPLEEAFGPLVLELWRTALLLVAGLALSVIATVALTRRMVQPIRALQEGAARIGAGQLDQRIEVRTGDELESLGEQFNRMAAELRDSYAGLERKVAERTRELQEALEQQTATSEILRVTSSSPTDIRPVFDAVAASAARLCEASDAVIQLRQDDDLCTVAHHGSIPYMPVGATRPISPGRVTGRALLEARQIHVEDLQESSAEYPEGAAVAKEVG